VKGGGAKRGKCQGHSDKLSAESTVAAIGQFWEGQEAILRMGKVEAVRADLDL